MDSMNTRKRKSFRRNLVSWCNNGGSQSLLYPKLGWDIFQMMLSIVGDPAACDAVSPSSGTPERTETPTRQRNNSAARRHPDGTACVRHNDDATVTMQHHCQATA